MKFVDERKMRFGGVEPICRVLPQHEVEIAPSTYYAARSRPPWARTVRDEQLLGHMRRLHAGNYAGPARSGTSCAARATRWPGVPSSGRAREHGLHGVRRSTRVRTATPEQGHDRPPIWSTATSPPTAPTPRESRTSPMWRPGAGSSTWPSSWMCSPGRSWAGRPGSTSAPRWCWTRSTWPCDGANAQASHPTTLRRARRRAGGLCFGLNEDTPLMLERGSGGCGGPRERAGG